MSNNEQPYVPVIDVHDFETMSGYHTLAPAAVGSVTAAWCFTVAALCFIGLIAMMRANTKTVRTSPGVGLLVRHHLMVVGVLAGLAGLAGALPVALAADSVYSALLCELLGGLVITLFLLRFSAALVISGQSANRDRCRDEAEGRGRRINPGSGYFISRGSIDAAGYTYGDGPALNEDRHWERDR
jgi:hypothetical protein